MPNYFKIGQGNQWLRPASATCNFRISNGTANSSRCTSSAALPWPRPIIAKFTYWKQKEKVLRAAGELKPEGVQFYPDFAKRTLQRRASQIPKLLEERKR